ncbi:MAG TPA: hypothetical protein VN259_02155 [Xanthomonadales bacterium]|nr:hypothetical protein [Xanthomonadales bacterium]
MNCAVGDRVAGEFGGGEIGTIAEIGRQSPHVGAYRIVFSWSPRGEWYHPNTWDVHPEGSADRCQPAQGGGAAGPDVGDDDPAPLASPPPPAQGTASTDRCLQGAQVSDRNQRAGVIEGENNGMCVVRLSDGSVRNYLAWMLSPAGAAPDTTGGGLSPGRYVCSTQGAGTFEVQILDASTYADRAGTRGRYAVNGEELEFQTGSLVDYYSRLLGKDKFGLSTEPVRTFYVVCDRKR